MKKRKMNFWVLAVACLGLVSCSNDDDGDAVLMANVNIQARTMITSETSTPSVVAGANLLNGTIRVRDVALVPANNPVSTGIMVGSAGGTQIVLLNSGLPANEVNMGSVTVPHGNYDRITLRLDRAREIPATDAMHNRSLRISGTVNDMLLEIYTDVEEIITTAIHNNAQTIDSNQVLYLNFDINALFNGIDLRTAEDGDGDGTIEVEPSNIDGNRTIYNRMVDNLPNAITVTAS